MASKAANKRYREKMRAMAETLKKAPCTDCGVQYPPYVMEWDHLDARLGGDTVGSMASGGLVSKERLLQEIAKCELVCANCHRTRTHFRRI